MYPRKLINKGEATALVSVTSQQEIERPRLYFYLFQTTNLSGFFRNFVILKADCLFNLRRKMSLFLF